MTNSASHLSAQDVQRYQLGLVDEQEQETIDRHVAECRECLERLATTSPTADRLLQVMQAAPTRTAKTLSNSDPVEHDASLATHCSLRSATTQRLSNLEDRSFGQQSLSVDQFISDSDDREIAEPPKELQCHPRYRIERKLGCGGMGTVWLARQTTMDRLVALKVIRSSLLREPDVMERFKREIRVAARLNHPNIATAYDAEQAGELTFLVVQYIDGENLLDIVQRGAMPIGQACTAIADAARGLAYAHDLGLVHRDIKPGNMIRGNDGNVRLIDFGLVAAKQEDAGLTNPGFLMGTLDYIAPEQAESGGNADARSDVYALGCSLYHLLSGQPPFVGRTLLRKLDCHRYEKPPPIKGLPAELSNVLNKMMAKRPEDRYQDAGNIANDLEQFCKGLASNDCLKQTTMLRRFQFIFVSASLLLVVGITLYSRLPERPLKLPASNIDDGRIEKDQSGPWALTSPSEIADGNPDDFRIEDQSLHINAMANEKQVWLNFSQFRSENWVLGCHIKIDKSNPSSYVKLILLSESQGELCLIIHRTVGKYWFALEDSSKPDHNWALTEDSLTHDFASEFVNLEFRLENQQLSAKIGDNRTLEYNVGKKDVYFPAVAAFNCIVEFRHLEGSVP